MPIDVKAYLSELAKSAGVADDKLQAALEVIGNETVAKKLGDDILRHDDYSRNMDSLRKREAEIKTYYEQQVAIAAKNQEIVNEYDAQVKKYKELYGELDGGTGRQPSVDTSNFIDKKTFDERMNQLGQQSIQITKIASRCTADYMKRFGEVLDMDALEKFTLESGLPLQAAYDKFIEPRNKEIAEQSFAEKLKKAREEGYTEGLSKVANPTDPGSPAPNGFMSNLLKKPDGAPNPRDAFVGAWNQAASKQ